jgi:DegV family protein with EDD domain
MKNKIKLITDSASDISYENEQKYDIQILPFGLSLGGRSYTSRVDFDNEQFYALMDTYDGIPTTSQITPFEFTEIFEGYYRSGYSDVIFTAINSAGSATYGNAVLAAGAFFDDHPDAADRFSLHIIDSGTYSGCYGYAVVEAAKKLENGCSAAHAAQYIRDWCDNAVA